MSWPGDAAPGHAGTITVTVTLVAGLRRFLPRGADGPQPCTLPEGATLGDLLAAIGIDAGLDLTAAVDGELAGRGTALRAGAEVMLLGPMEGGSFRRRGQRPSTAASGARGRDVNPLAEERTHMAQLRIPLDAQRFATGMTWKDYMAQMGDTRARTEDNDAKSTLTEEERRFFGGVSQVRYMLMLVENWCGDVHRNSPLIAHIAEAMPGCELRLFFRDQNLDLTDCFLNNGYRSIPIVVFFDQDWNEIGRWIERAHAATAKVVGIRARTLEAAAPDRQDAAMAEYRKDVQAEYDRPGGPLWRAAASEVRLILEQRLGLAGKK
jgi:sulfur carrier protein ThiS